MGSILCFFCVHDVLACLSYGHVDRLPLHFLGSCMIDCLGYRHACTRYGGEDVVAICWEHSTDLDSAVIRRWISGYICRTSFPGRMSTTSLLVCLSNLKMLLSTVCPRVWPRELLIDIPRWNVNAKIVLKAYRSSSMQRVYRFDLISKDSIPANAKFLFTCNRILSGV
jgi:hypothetical protein